MAKANSNSGKRVPKVRIAKPKGRPYQLRYTCPIAQREIRISIGSRDDSEAERRKAELEAKLLLGIDPKPKHTAATGPGMAWADFREQYSTLQLAALRDDSVMHAESRLDIAERILKPRTLGDVASGEALHRLQAALLAGEESRRGKPRSPYTVKGYIGAVLAAMNWANLQGWLPSVPRIRKVKVGKFKAMKGRPIGAEEFERMLAKTESVVGKQAAPSWDYLCRGLWESALRLDELMHVSWDIPDTIMPVWRRGALPVLRIPGAMQKNGDEEDIPLLPWFEAVLLETPPEERTGWVFNPESLQTRIGRRARHGRFDAEWVGKVVTRIGKAAGVIVEQAAPSSTHRRTTCGALAASGCEMLAFHRW